MTSDILKIVAVNLIAFHDTKAIGTMVFTQRLLKQLDRTGNIDRYKFIIYIQRHIDINEICCFENCEVEIVRVPTLKSAIKRIVFEQTLFYRYQKKCDIFFTPTLSLPLFARGKKILTIHDMVPYRVIGKYNSVRLAYIKTATWLYAMLSDLILTVSEHSRADICSILNIHAEKIKVIYNFIPETEMILRRENFSEIIEIEEPYLLTVSTLQPAKNIGGLIQSFNLFHQSHPDYHLYIVGNKGWGYEPLFELTCKLHLEQWVHFTGYLNDEQVAFMYENCEGVVYVSFYEGFGIPPLEGFHHGKVCVASATSSIPEVVGEAGILVDPYDINAISCAIVKMLNQKDQLATAIPRQIAKFNPEKQSNLFLEIIDLVLLQVRN